MKMGFMDVINQNVNHLVLLWMNNGMFNFVIEIRLLLSVPDTYHASLIQKWERRRN